MGLSVLLDTPVLLWAFASPDRLSPSAGALLEDPLTDALVSAASAWEIATTYRLGKLPGAEVSAQISGVQYFVIPARGSSYKRSGRSGISMRRTTMRRTAEALQDAHPFTKAFTTLHKACPVLRKV